MALSAGYLTSKQMKIWDLKRRGFLEAGIARELSVSRQTVHKAADVADRKVSQALMEMAKLNKLMGGFKEMTSLPGALFIIDPTKEKIALMEAQKVGVKIVATVDTNCNPEGIDYVIPANDDAIKAIKVICSQMADAVLQGKALAESLENRATELDESATSETVAA